MEDDASDSDSDSSDSENGKLIFVFLSSPIRNL